MFQVWITILVIVSNVHGKKKVPQSIPKLNDKLDLVKLWVQQKVLEQKISNKESGIVPEVVGDFDEELTRIERTVLSKDPSQALERYEEIYKSSQSPKALLGQAIALKVMSDRLLGKEMPGATREAITLRLRAADNAACKLLIERNAELDKFTLVKAGRLCFELAKSIGNSDLLIDALREMHRHYPRYVSFKKQTLVDHVVRALNQRFHNCTRRHKYSSGHSLKNLRS